MNASRGHTLWLIVLTALVALALAGVGAMIWIGYQFTASARDALDRAVGWTEELGREVITYEFPVYAEVPVALEVPFEDTFYVPINHQVTVQTEIAIDEVVEVPVSTPLGTWNLRIPVKMTVPVEVQVPIELEVDVPVQTSIQISTSVPFRTIVPVEIDLAATPLQGYLDELGSELGSLRDLLAGGWGPFRLGAR